eukprot:gnl/TRDRNA2_/TRDRNA2_36626_c0_seq1.p1 gnl/TRDRNA2_/TRDRNA2_36626_c0~~gnl/TRDRNA2_/TRDRNA2_36626_c0_seq1.p1  ORF type:complete len:413 (-),score=90.66 gnl/TRDRNA2_/TRDRNA2_36626_c0_seq1:216-1454(-)
MSHRRAIYAARFLRPPGFAKRLVLREKPRELTGPYENPVRRWVRLREKARQFSELPPPRKIPVPKPARRKNLQEVEGVPDVKPHVLLNRLNFLLSPLAAEQQLAAPLRPGLTPYTVEVIVWRRQMRDLRRIYRAQYLQKLAEVTESERQKEQELHQRELEERRRRKQAHLQRVGEDMKRRAILKDRKRIEQKVTEAMEMARRSKVKRQRLFWFRRMENLSKVIVSAENFEEHFPAVVKSGPQGSAPPALDVGTDSGRAKAGALLSRNVSVPFLLRQLGGAKTFPLQRSRRIPHVDNVQREILESSYDLLAEDEERFEPEPAGGPSHRERAKQLYGGFSEKEKRGLLQFKIEMLKAKVERQEAAGIKDNVLITLLEELRAADLAAEEPKAQEEGKTAAKAARGKDPPGLPRGM